MLFDARVPNAGRLPATQEPFMIAAHVTVEDDLKMIVRHDDIQAAIDHLAPASAGSRVEVVIEYKEMADEEFTALPELQ
jgi:hypothetical protein